MSGLAEFSEKGFAAARMEDIAKRAEVAKGTIYLHFADKQALFAGIVRQAIVPLVDDLVLRKPDPGETVGAYLRRIAVPLAASIVAPPRADIVRLLAAEGPRFPELAEMYYREVVARAMSRVRELAELAFAQGEVDSDVFARFPQLLVAPALVGIFWSGLFSRMEPLDVPALVRAQIDLLFPAGADG